MSDTRQGKASFVTATNVSRETLVRLEVYAALLEKWNPAINLVAPSTVPDLWHRHFLDSAQVVALVDKATTSWVDLGTGGGFPGLIVAILAQETLPGLQLTCIESDQRKATFLRTVVRETGINVAILSKRIDAVDPLKCDVVSARALASLPDLLGMAQRHLSPTGQAILLKGTTYQGEVEAARRNWAFDMDVVPSKTDREAVILKLGNISRV